jgi:hypothetical protein
MTIQQQIPARFLPVNPPMTVSTLQPVDFVLSVSTSAMHLLHACNCDTAMTKLK